MTTTILAFLLALAVLIAVHEYGHYRVAVACGVRVLRFSVGFGQVLFRWKPSGSETEFVVCAFPLGGYVRMLDEREAPVAAELRHLAFNRQSVGVRAAIVAAGPLLNLLLAVLLYAVVNWSGVEQPAAVLATPTPGSVAEQARLLARDRVVATGADPEQAETVRSFDELRWRVAQAALDGQDIGLALSDGGAGSSRWVWLRLSGLGLSEVDADLYRRVGIVAPYSEPLVGGLMPEGAGARAGLREGDRVLRIAERTIDDAQALRDAIRGQVRSGQPLALPWQIERDGKTLTIPVEPALVDVDGQKVARIGAYVGGPPEMVQVRYGPVEGLVAAFDKTWEVATLTLRMLWRMVIGEASLKNLNGPLTIADYAGKSAHLGLTPYLLFLALISISLGVLNLLPLPVLDGGHLMYYLWEAVTGKAVSDAWMELLQRGGVAMLMMLMGIALYNDLVRILG